MSPKDEVNFCLPGVLAFSSSTWTTDGGCLVAAVMGSILFTGACLLPGIIRFTVLSGELYIPNTSASASFVLIVTVGSPKVTILLRFPYPIFCVLRVPSSLKFTRTVSRASEGGGEPHFLLRSPMERARTSAALYSTPSPVKSSERLKRSFSGRLPGTGGASIGA